MKKTNEDIIPIIDKQERMEFIKKNLYTMTYDELAPYVGMASGDSVRQFCKRNSLPNKRDNHQARRNDISLNEKIKQFISIKQRTLSELCNEFNVSPATIEKELKAIKKNNVLIDNIDNAFKLGTTIQVEEEPVSIDTKKYGETEFCFGAVADTHIGSKYERLDALNAIYDRFQEYGIDTVYHGGNWIDGECRFNKFDVYTIGVEDQIKNFVAKYPQRKGIKTFIVSGDDHEGWYVQREHINVGKAMQDEAIRQGRNDLIDVGYMERDFELKQKKGSAILRLIHAGGGSSYALSYTSQKYAESMQGGEKPQIVLVGHYHKFDYSYPREMHIIQIGCFEDQTPFMRKKRLQAMVGGCVIWVRQNELGIITSCKVEWIPFYSKKFYQYNW